MNTGTTERRSRLASLQRLLNPSSIAVVGVSATETAFGSRAFNNLNRFSGRLYAVNARQASLYGYECYRSVSKLPEVPDCVIVAVPLGSVEGVVEECASLGVGGVVVFASDYSETQQPDGIALQARLAAISAGSDTRVLGPNCMGFANFARGTLATFSANTHPESRPGSRSIGLVSQSGALGFGLAQASERGISFSHVFSVGNSCDVDIADQIMFLATEANCASIACLFESMPDPRRLLEAAEQARQNGKPLLVFKLGQSERGTVAALSHTGMLTGSAAAFDAAFAKAGIIKVDRIEHLIETAAFFAKAPPCRSEGVAVFSVSGGTAIIAADEAEFSGVDLPQPAAVTRDVLARHVPNFGSIQNPFDVTAAVANDPAKLRSCAEALMADVHYGALVVPHPSASQGKKNRIESYSELASLHAKPVCIVWTSEWLEGPGAQDMESDPHVAVFRSMSNCFKTLSAWHAGARYQAMESPPTRRSPIESRADAAAVMANCPGTTLTESISKKVLSAYGVPVVHEHLARNVEDAIAAVATVGYPIAMKIQSPDIPHKTEAGVVRLNVGTEAELRNTHAALLAQAEAFRPGSRIDGVLIQPMMQPGVEVLVGAKVDRQLGPLIVVGIGGVLVELVKDTVLDLAPVSLSQANAMLDRLRSRAIFEGFRGAPPISRVLLADVICRISELIADHADEIAEVDVNPLVCSQTQVMAVDALIVRNARPPAKTARAA